MEEVATFLFWAVSCSQGQVDVCLSLEHKGPMPPVVPRWCPRRSAVFQEPGWALSIVSEAKALTYTLLARLITFYLKLKFSNS